jgi:hypothetical protein
MKNFASVDKIGLRDKSTKKLIVVYPYKPQGTDAEIDKIVKDWYYKQNCSAEDKILNAQVDFLTEYEMKSIK